jgi:hypothetical protein
MTRLTPAFRSVSTGDISDLGQHPLSEHLGLDATFGHLISFNEMQYQI